MRDIDRMSFRTGVYLVIFIYFALLIVGGALDFVLTAIEAGPLLSEEHARWLEALRFFSMSLLAWPSRLVSLVWPTGGGFILAYPLVMLGVVAFLVAGGLFSLVDVIRRHGRK